jgi:hypothetical protein
MRKYSSIIYTVSLIYLVSIILFENLVEKLFFGQKYIFGAILLISLVIVEIFNFRNKGEK